MIQDQTPVRNIASKIRSSGFDDYEPTAPLRVLQYSTPATDAFWDWGMDGQLALIRLQRNGKNGSALD